MLQCLEGSVWLILDMPCLLGTAAGQSLWQISATAKQNHKIVCSQHTKHGTAEPFHFFHMGPMSDVTMLRRLCLADFGHAMSLGTGASHKVWQISATAKPNHKVVCSQHRKHGTAEPFHFLHMDPMSDVTMLRGLCLADYGHAMAPWHCCWPKGLADFSHSQAKP
jgi:hypothetical protein